MANGANKYQFRAGPSQVVRAVFDIRDTMPFGIRPDFQPVAEARAIRPWEEFDETIQRWGVDVTIAAVAGEFGTLAVIPPDPAGGFPLAEGTISVIDRIVVTSNARLTIGTTADFAAAGLGVVASPRSLDSRWGLNQVPLNVASGTHVAQVGTQCGVILPAIAYSDAVVQGTPKNTGNAAVFYFVVASTAFTAIEVGISGRLIYARQ